MIHNRQDVGDRLGTHIPLTAFGVDDQEFDELYEKLKDVVDLRETQTTKVEYFVVCWDPGTKWLYDQYKVVGGDILFQRGPLPAGDPDPGGRLPFEWAPVAIPNPRPAVKIVVERHPDGFVAYPLGLKGVVVGQGDTFDEAVADVSSAIRFHVETFGPDAVDTESPVLEVYLTEAQVA